MIVRPLIVVTLLLAACGGGDDGSSSVSLVCEAFDLDDANALVTNSDTGERKIEGDIRTAVLFETEENFGGSTVGIVAINVGSHVVTLVEVLPNGPWASMDDLSERATSFPQNPNRYGVSENTDGVTKARECASSGDQPTTTAPASGFDVEAWRAEAIKRFGPEETFDDGSKDDYVQLAHTLCDQSANERATMRSNLGPRYEGSLQQFILEEFCPNV